MNNRPYYGIIGNGETCAFISPTGNIEWLCLPQFDGQLVYSKSINRMGGSLDIQINENGRQLLAQETRQKYVEKTAVLKTNLKFKPISVEMTDFMPWPEPEAMNSEKRALFKLVEIKNTSRKTLLISIKVRSNVSGRKYREIKEKNIISAGSYAFSITFLGNQLEKIKIKSGESKTIPVILVYGKNADEVKHILAKKKLLNPDVQLKKCITFWHNWIDKGHAFQSNNEGYQKAYYSSLVAMKLMNFEKSGAIMAAATTSLPASQMGTHSWDYRFVWIRDAYYACRAMLATGHFDEVKKQLAFFYRIQGSNGHWSSPFYTIDGKIPGDEIEIDLGEEILRLSNAAKDQLQLDSEGSVLYATYLYFLYSKDIDLLGKNWGKIKSSANWTARNYSREENGIWEFRHRTSHWTYGKVMCYLAVDSAIKIAKILQKTIPKQWIRARKSIIKDVDKNSWSDHRKVFTQTYDKDSSIDISVIALEDYGLIKASDRKMLATVKLLENKLNLDGGIKRNEDAHLPFYFSTLWLAAHYIRVGNLKRAEELVTTCIESSTDLYLCAEHFDAKNRIQYGNFPQTFSASMLIERILDIEKKGFDIEKFFDFLNNSIRKAMSYDKEELLKWSEKEFEYHKK